MKKMRVGLCILLLSLFAGIQAQEHSRTIHLEVAGTLPDSVASTEKYQITNLTLSGNFNGTDIRLIREMAGVDAQDNPTEGRLAVLDMSNATIVAGGSAYLDNYQTANQQLGPFIFSQCKFHTFVIPESIVSIGTNAFFNCMNLDAVIIPANVMDLADYAFYGCTSLKDFRISDSDKQLKISGSTTIYNCPIETLYLGRGLSSNTFRSCATLTRVKIGNQVTTLGVECFSDCTNLVSAIVGSGVTFIDSYAFSNCTSLKELRLEDGEKVLNLSRNSVFNNNPIEKLYLGRNLIGENPALGNSSVPMEVTIGSQVSFLPERLFFDHKGLKSIDIPANVDSIAGSAFYGCTSLRSVRFLDSKSGIRLPNINTFQSCPIEQLYLGRNILEESTLLGNYQDLKEVIIGDDVTFINRALFAFCENLKTVVIPNGVDSIAEAAFSNCKSLSSVTFGKNLKYIGYSAFSSCESLTSLTLPDGLDKISGYAFSTCNNLTSIDIGRGVTRMDDGVFVGCTSLNEVRVPDGNNEISVSGYRLFEDCPVTKFYLGRNLKTGDRLNLKNTLAEMNLGEGLTRINDEFLKDYAKLATLAIPSSVTSIGASAFSGCNLDTVFVLRAEPAEVSASIGLEDILVFVNPGSEMVYRQTPVWNKSIIKGVNEAMLEIQVHTPGSLTSEIVKAGMRAPYVGRLKLSGTLDKTDWEVIRTDMGCLYEIDMSALSNNEIPDFIFGNKKLLLSVVLPDHLTKLGDHVFAGCANLKGNIVFPASLSSVGRYAFSNTALSSVQLAGEEYTIQEGAFSDCRSLRSVRLSGRYSIGNAAFKGSAIATLEPLTGLTGLGFSAFEECRRLKGTVVLSGIRELPQSVFYNCDSIQAVTLPEELSQISIQAFMGCSQLENVSWPDSLKTIEMNAFAGCEKLKTVALPEGIGQLNKGAFLNCKGLTEVKVHTKLPLVISADVFEGVNYSKCVLSVPRNSVENYKQAKGWQNFFDIREGDYYGYNLLKLICGKNGSLSIRDQQITDGELPVKVYEGTPEGNTLMIIPDTGYRLETALLDGTDVLPGITGNTYLLPAFQADAAFSATFLPVHYDITASVAQGEGVVRINGLEVPSVKANHGSNVVFEFIPGQTYEVSEVLMDGNDVTDELQDNRLTIEKITGEHSLSVEFRKMTYRITTVVTGNGRLEMNGSSEPELTFDAGTSVKIVVLPEEGYELYRFTVEGYDLTNEVRKLGYLTTEMDRNLAIEAEFRKPESIRQPSAVSYRVEGNNLILSGLSPAGRVDVYASGSGMLLQSIDTTDSGLTLSLPQSRIYIVSVGGTCFKVKM